MLKTNKSAPGVTRSLSATALIAATLLAGSLSEASAKSRKHHHHGASSSHSWKDANAAIPSSGTGGSFAGVASFYGNESGSKTASGQRFNENDMTAAHRSLPLASFAKVTNLDNGRSVVVKINDRGPFTRGRILDLSPRAADVLDMKRAGVVAVVVEPLVNETASATLAMF